MNMNHMSPKDLVILKAGKELTKGETQFKPNTYYRCSEYDDKSFVIYGEPITKEERNELFETAQERVIRDWKEMGLVTPDGKAISKTAFVKQADIHQYGNGRSNYKIWYFRDSRERTYGFYPMQGNKTENTNECYEYYLDILNGNLDPLDCKDICFGNCGIPISYAKLRVI